MPTKPARSQLNRSRWSGRQRSAKPSVPIGTVRFGNVGRNTHVILTVEEYERLVVAKEAGAAQQTLADPKTEWVDWEDVKHELAAKGIEAARKSRGLTQKQLGDLIGVPQSQISRLERNPDATTVRTLRKVAKALGVQLGALI